MKICLNTNIHLLLFLAEVNMKIDGCHISINKGDTGVIRFIFSYKKQREEVGQRYFRLIIKKNKEESDGSAIFDVSKQGASVTDNYIAFAIPADVTDNEVGNYFWGLRVFGDGYVNTIKEGVFTIDRGTYYGAN